MGNRFWKDLHIWEVRKDAPRQPLASVDPVARKANERVSVATANPRNGEAKHWVALEALSEHTDRIAIDLNGAQHHEERVSCQGSSQKRFRQLCDG
jgi:hypothetical protein